MRCKSNKTFLERLRKSHQLIIVSVSMMFMLQTRILNIQQHSKSLKKNLAKWKGATIQQCSNRNAFVMSSSSSKFSSSTTNNNHNNDKTKQLMNELSNLGYKDANVVNGMLEAIAQCQSKKVSSLDKSSIQMFGKEGLAALAKSVQNELQINKNNNFVGTIHFLIPHHNNTKFSLEMNENQSLMQLAKDTSLGREILGEYIECACGGNMSCSTCHVYLDKESYKKMDEPCEAELDMLDLAHEPESTSRLGCQIHMKPELENMTIIIPSGVNNFWN